MKRSILLPAVMTLLCAAAGAAQSIPAEGAVTVVNGKIEVDVPLHLRELKVKSEQAVVYAPSFVVGTDTVALPGVGVYGRSRYIRHQRGNDRAVAPAVAFKASKAPALYNYHTEIPYSASLEGADLVVVRRIYGCAACSKGEDVEPTGLAMLVEPKMDYSDAFVFEAPKAETVKVRQLEGRANVEFPVNRTVLLTDFRRNSRELAKVRASIDSVRNDKDVQIKSMKIVGFASPEGSYDNNVRLASGRTVALCDYVKDYYSLPEGLVKTAWVPEDWDGLRRWVLESDMDARDGLLRIINNEALAPDARDARLKKDYPIEYAFLLKNVYPSLRHTDYRIEYVVRSYNDPIEIMKVMKTRPEHLSLNEFYVVAKDLNPDSDEYAYVTETAARVYPDDPVANLNAGNVALRRGDLISAAGYLGRAGDTPMADHSRGVLAMMQGDFDKAETLLSRSAAQGVKHSEGMLEQVRKMLKYRKSTIKEKK